MNYTEAMKIVSMIETNWQPVKDQEAAYELWASAFESDPFELVKTAVMVLIQTDPGEFRPTVAKVRRKMHDIVYGNRLTETEAWLLVKESMHEAQQGPETLKGAKSAWQKLPDDIKKLVTPKELYEWNSVEYETLDTVIQSNFMRSYRDVRDRRYEKETLSAGVSDTVKKLQSASPVYKELDVVEKPKLPEPEKQKFDYTGMTPSQVVGFDVPMYMESTVQHWMDEGLPKGEIRRRAVNF